MKLLLLTVAVIAAVMLLMAVGALFRGRCLRGSCGGAPVVGPDGKSLSCETCPRREEMANQATATRTGGSCSTPFR